MNKLNKLDLTIMNKRFDQTSFKGSKSNFLYSKRICKTRGGGSYGEYHQYSPYTGIKTFSNMSEYCLENICYKKNTREYKELFMEAALINLFYGEKIAKVVLVYEWDDKERLHYMHLKEASIERALLIEGNLL